MSCVWMLQRGHSGDGCVLASTLCKYDLRKGDLFLLSWARVRRVRWGSISMVSSNNETVVLRMIYKSTLKCSNDSSRLWWNWQFCEKI